jgi:hypothetical protein
MEDIEERIRDELGEHELEIAKGRSFLFDNIDSFVALSREDTSVGELELYPFDIDAENYEFWDKVGQMVGNLTELIALTIHFDSDRYGNWENCSPDWEILSRILRYLRRTVTLWSTGDDYYAEAEEVQGLARVIHGHPMISEFTCLGCTFENFGPWCSALATLPSLKRVTLGLHEPEPEEQRVLVNPESLTDLLRTPALRSVKFDGFSFTNALCHAVANALEEGSPVTDITFESCPFPVGGVAIIANALNTNASVTAVIFRSDVAEPFFNNLAAVLLCNSTLQYLNVHAATRASGRWFSSIFLSLGMNTTLKSLSVGISDEFGDELCAAIRSGLAKNSTLEKLSLHHMVPSDDDGAVSARNALSFLRTNSTLKSLTVSFRKPSVQAQMESNHISAFRLEAVKMMENSFLESLTIHSSGRGEFEELFALISALQLNTTLKTLGHYVFSDSLESHYLSDDEAHQLVSILMKNYGLESLVPTNSGGANNRTVRAILRLNGAGRRYLIEDGSSISKGVDVLSAVNDDINCVFLHLLENPGLCNRRALETTRSRRPGENLDESSSTGKRERVQLQPGKEPRRRLD